MAGLCGGITVSSSSRRPKAIIPAKSEAKTARRLRSVTPLQRDLMPSFRPALLHFHQQSVRSRRLEHPAEEHDRKNEIHHVQPKTPLEVRGRKPAISDSLPHTFE